MPRGGLGDAPLQTLARSGKPSLTRKQTDRHSPRLQLSQLDHAHHSGSTDDWSQAGLLEVPQAHPGSNDAVPLPRHPAASDGPARTALELGIEAGTIERHFFFCT